MIGLIFQKKLTLTKQMHQNSVIFVITGTFEVSFNYESYLCNGWHDIMQKAMNFNVAIVSVKGSNYRIYFWYANKNDAVNIMKNSNLKNEKNGLS